MRPRTLEILALLVVALAIWVLVDRPPAGLAPLPDRLVPGLAPSHVARLRIVGPGRPEVALEKGEGGWRLQPAALAVDDDAVTDLLGTLEYLAARRRVPAGAAAVRGLDAPRLSLEIDDSDGAVHRLRIGAAEPLLGRTWVTLGGDSDYLVDDYAVRALDRRPDDLRRRTVFGSAKKIALRAGGHDLRLDGDPACVELLGGCAAADRARTGALRRHLTDLALSRFLPAPPDGPAELRAEADGAWLEATDTACPGASDERQVRSSAGAGCVAAASLTELGRDVAPPLAWVEASPLALPGGDVDRVAIGELVLERKGGGWRRHEGEVVDGEAVRGWLDALASFRGKVAEGAPAAVGPSVTISAGAAAETLILAPGSGPAVLRRGSEPVTLTVHPGVRALFAADATAFADRGVLAFEPTALAEIIAAGPGDTVEDAVRGATTESFALIRPAPLAVEGARLAELRDVASHLRAARIAGAKGLDRIRRRLTFVVDPPVGEDTPRRLVLELGPDLPEGGCTAARAGEGTVYLLAAPACAVLAAPLASRRVFAVAPEEVTTISAFGRTAERHGGFWYAPDGARLDAPAAADLGALVRLLAVAPAVVGYGPLAPGGSPVVLGQVQLHVARGEYALDGRPVRYRVPDEICRRFPPACR